MQVIIKTNAAVVAKDYARANDAIVSDLEKGFAEASQAIAADFRIRQLSGRTRGDVGLNVQTGNLRSSLSGDGMRDGMDIVGTVSNSGATYWEYHQDGSGRLKKRLFFYERFATEGLRRYTSVAEKAFSELSR